MKRYFFISIAIMFLIASCDDASNKTNSIEQIGITIEQNGVAVVPSNGVVVLDKKEFNIVLDFPGPMAALVNASFNDELYQTVSSGKSLMNRSEFSEANLMAIKAFNPDQIIYLAEVASSPWFYENDQSHNFNKVEFINNHYRCTRTVKQFLHQDAPDHVDVKDIDDPLYLVFAPEAMATDSSGNTPFKGKVLKIEWNKNDQQQQQDNEVIEQQEVVVDFIGLNEDKNIDAATVLISRIIEQLALDQSTIASEFITSAIRPDRPREVIVVVPEIAKEEEDYFELNNHLVIADQESGKIISEYYEPSNWTSDAVILSDITIDTTPYMITDDIRAFGLRTHHHTLSQPNPYSINTLTLFIQSDIKLKPILNDYEVVESVAEWDTRCAGKGVHFEKTLKTTNSPTNDYYDISVANEITRTETYEKTKGDCRESKWITFEEIILKYDGEQYKEAATFVGLEVFDVDPQRDGISLYDEPNGTPTLKLNDDDEHILTTTVVDNGWSKVIKGEGVEGGALEIPGGYGWIKNTEIGVSIRQTKSLWGNPERDVEIGTIEQEMSVNILDKYIDWVQIEHKGLIGWIEAEWLCGNPVTTCP